MSSEAESDDVRIVHAHVKTLWDGGVKTTSLIRGFEVVADAPKWKYGTNSAPAPGEIFLASIGACFTSTFTKCAQERGLIIDGVTTDMRGVIDHEMDGRETLKTIEMQLKVHALERYREELEQCYERAKTRCPLTNAVSCEMKICYKFVKE